MSASASSEKSIEQEWVLAEDVQDVIPDQTAPPPLRVEGALEYSVISDGECTIKAVLSVIAPTPVDEKRAPLRLVAVLDKSGSMQGEKLDLVRKTMLYMLKHLSAKDELGIVEYDSTVNVLCRLTRCDAAGRAHLEASLKRLKAGTQTNLSGGLLKGLELHSNGLCANVSPPSVEEQHAFLDYAKNAEWDRVQSLLKGNSALVNCQPGQRWSALHQAVYAGSVSAVDFLLASGASTSSKTKDGQLPVDLAESDELREKVRPMEAPSSGSDHNPVSNECTEETPVAEEGVVRSTFLFTDGLANNGITNHEKLVEAAKRALIDLGEKKSTLSTFGFGKDHSAELLKNLASIDGFQGIYNYVENEDSVGQAFGEALGGLLTTTHQNVQLKLELGDGVKFSEAFTTYQVESRLANDAGCQELTVELGDLFAEERRDILLSLDLPSGISELMCGRVSARGFSVHATNYEDTSFTEMVVQREGDHMQKEQHPQVVRHWNRHVMTKALANARKSATRGDFPNAQKCIDDAVRTINESPLTAQQDEISQGLLKDLQICRAGLVDQRRYREEGSHRMMNLEVTHTRQRACNTTGYGASDFYCNARSRMMRADFDQEMSRGRR